MGTFTPIDNTLEQVARFTPAPRKLSSMDKFLGGVRSTLSGTTMGFSDELGSAMAAVMAKMGGSEEDFSDLYRGMKNAYNIEQDEFELQYPKTSLALTVVGGLGTGGAGAAKTAAMQGGKRVAALGGIGAGYGAVSGAGFARQGKTPEGVVQGGVLGGTLGLTIPVVGSLVGTMFQKMMTKQPPNAADRKVLAAILDDGDTPQALKRELVKWNQGGEGATIMDVGGESLVNLARSARDTAGKSAQASKEFLEGRVQGEFDRLTNGFKKLLGNKGEFFKTVDDLRSSRKIASKKVYERAFRTHIQVTPRLQQLLERPVMKSAYKMAIKRARNRGITLDDKVVDTRRIDAIKKELDNKIYGKKIGPEERAVLLELKHAMLREVDQQNLLYKEARNIWSGSKAAEDAAEEGARFMRGDQSVMARSFEKLSDVEKEFFKVGAIRGFRQYIGNTQYNNTIAQKLNNPNMVERLKSVLGPDDYKKFETALSKERRYTEVKNKVLSGSQTHNKQAGADALMDVGNIAVNAGQGNMGSTAHGMLQALRKFGRKQSVPVSDRITDQVTTNTSLPQNLNYLDSLGSPTQIHPRYRRLVDTMAQTSGILSGR